MTNRKQPGMEETKRKLERAHKAVLRAALLQRFGWLEDEHADANGGDVVQELTDWFKELKQDV